MSTNVALENAAAESAPPVPEANAGSELSAKLFYTCTFAAVAAVVCLTW